MVLWFELGQVGLELHRYCRFWRLIPLVVVLSLVVDICFLRLCYDLMKYMDEWKWEASDMLAVSCCASHALMADLSVTYVCRCRRRIPNIMNLKDGH